MQLWKKLVIVFFIILAVFIIRVPPTFWDNYFSSDSKKEIKSNNVTAFRSELWKDTLLIRTKSSVRLHMTNQLLTKYKLTGKNRKEVINRLGKPDKEEKFTGKLVYWLGLENNLFGKDSVWLVIKFKEEIVSAYEIFKN